MLGRSVLNEPKRTLSREYRASHDFQAIINIDSPQRMREKGWASPVTTTRVYLNSTWSYDGVIHEKCHTTSVNSKRIKPRLPHPAKFEGTPFSQAKLPFVKKL